MCRVSPNPHAAINGSGLKAANRKAVQAAVAHYGDAVGIAGVKPVDAGGGGAGSTGDSAVQASDPGSDAGDVAGMPLSLPAVLIAAAAQARTTRTPTIASMSVFGIDSLPVMRKSVTASPVGGLCVINREAEFDFDGLLSAMGPAADKIIRVTDPEWASGGPEYSSTAIRAACRAGEPIDHLVPPAVAAYHAAHALTYDAGVISPSKRARLAAFSPVAFADLLHANSDGHDGINGGDTEARADLIAAGRQAGVHRRVYEGAAVAVKITNLSHHLSEAAFYREWDVLVAIEAQRLAEADAPGSEFVVRLLGGGDDQGGDRGWLVLPLAAKPLKALFPALCGDDQRHASVGGSGGEDCAPSTSAAFCLLPSRAAFKLQVCADLAAGLAWLHDGVGVLHRDLKVDNLLVFGGRGGTGGDEGLQSSEDEAAWDARRLRFVICDFGVSKRMADHSEVVRGSVRHYAPESICQRRREYSFASDVWMAATVFWELAAEAVWFGECSSVGQVRAQVLDHHLPALDGGTLDEMGDAFRELLSADGMLAFEAGARPTAAAVAEALGGCCGAAAAHLP